MNNILASWRTSLLGLLMAVFGVIQISKAPSFKDAFTNPTVQIAMVGAALGFLAKDNSVTGTAANPRAQVQGETDPPAKT